MSPADITAGAEFRAGLYRRLAEVGLVPPQSSAVRLTAPAGAPASAADEDRKAA